jgi:hypothetical protein
MEKWKTNLKETLKNIEKYVVLQNGKAQMENKSSYNLFATCATYKDP